MSGAALLGNVGFIGAGALGSALARAMRCHGYVVSAIASRTAASAVRLAGLLPECEAASPQNVADRCNTVFLTVPDDAIASVAASVRWRAGQAVVHCSGAMPLSTLGAAGAAGARVGAFHPLQTFAGDFDAVEALQGIAYAIEAPSPLDDALGQLAEHLGGWPLELSSEDRALYHASAIAACGLMATLLKLSADLWDGFSQAGDRALPSLLPLARSTLKNIERQGLPTALTGPAARGDVGVVRMHLDALADRAPGFLPLYSALSLAALPIARGKGTLAELQEEQLRAMLTASLANAKARNEGAPCV